MILTSLGIESLDSTDLFYSFVIAGLLFYIICLRNEDDGNHGR